MGNFLASVMIGIGLLLSGCTNSTILATALPAADVKLAQVPPFVKGGTDLNLNFQNQSVAGKTVVSLNALYSVDGIHFLPIASLSVGATSYLWHLPLIDSENAQFKLVAKDSRGVTTETFSNTFSILTTPPLITLGTSSAVSSSSSSASFSGTCEPGDVIHLIPAPPAGASAAMLAHYAAIPNPTCTAQGLWSLIPTESTLNGTFHYTLKQIDPVGNFTQVSFSWTRNCAAGQVISGESCVTPVCTPLSLDTPDRTGCSNTGTRNRSCSADGFSWGSYSACSCDAGYAGATCTSCATGYYFNGSACVLDACVPNSVASDSTGCSNHGTETRTCAANGSGYGAYTACSCASGYTGATCSSCASGYNFNGTACVSNSCTPNAVQSDSSGCSNHGSHSQTCASNGSGWGAYTACSCATGYTGATCSSCASGYYFNGTSCVVDACTPNQVVSDSASCSNQGSHSHTCAADGSGFGAYSACTCNTGYSGASCASCASGYVFNGTSCVATSCTANQVVSDTSGCSSNGTRSHTCAADGSGFGAYTSCSCGTGYSGASCGSCASGYYNNGTACVADVCSPSSVDTQNPSSACSNVGIRSRTCAADGSAWSAYSACSCSAGYAGSDCSSCDTSNGYSLVGGTCIQAVTVNYSMTEASATYYTNANYTDANLVMTTSSDSISAPGNTTSTAWNLTDGSTITVNCYGRSPPPTTGTTVATDASAWPTSGNPGLNLIIKDKDGTVISDIITHNGVASVVLHDGSLPSFVASAAHGPYTVDCHSFRSAPSTYTIGVFYQPALFPAQMSGGVSANYYSPITATCNSTTFDGHEPAAGGNSCYDARTGSKIADENQSFSAGGSTGVSSVNYGTYGTSFYTKTIPSLVNTYTDGPYTTDEGWSGVEWYNFWQTNGNSTGYMDGLYAFVRKQFGYGGTCLDANCYTETGAWGTAGAVRINRAYSERQPTLGGVASWFEFFDSAAEKKQVDAMKNAGIDFTAILSEWEPVPGNCPVNDTALVNGAVVPVTQDTTYGCLAYNQAMDYFLWENYNRDRADQVLAAMEFGDIDNFSSWQANATTPGGATAQGYKDLFNGRIQWAIDHYFNYRDAKGNPLYLYLDGKPVIFLYNTAGFMTDAAIFGVSVSELLAKANLTAQHAGYSGIYWVDAASGILKSDLTNSNYAVSDYVNYQNMIRNAGFNAETGWMHHATAGVFNHPDNQNDTNFRGYNEAIAGYSAIWAGILGDAVNHPGSSFKYMVPVTPGWDPRPVGEGPANYPHDISRSCDGTGDGSHANDSYHNTGNTPWGCSTDGGLFSTMLTNAKTAIDNHTSTTDRMLMITTWNDVGEGHYIQPSVGDGGAHAQAVKNVFKP